MSIDEEFDRIWEHGENAPDLGEFFDRHSSATASEKCRAILIDQFHRWQQKIALPPESYFKLCPAVGADPVARAEILLEEIGYREANTDVPFDVLAFINQYPADRRQLLIELRLPSNGESSEEIIPSIRDAGESESAQVPETLGRYQVEKALGQGAFGTVYLASDSELSRSVAIKVPARSVLNRFDDADSFLREARIVAALNHPNIVPVYDVGKFGGDSVYIVTRFVDGGHLGEVRDSLSLRRVAEVVACIARALHHAHLQGVVHRDVKPANILLGRDGTPYLVDFGLSKQEIDHHASSQWIGTPSYMSPEQARGEGHRVDGRSDIFGLGVILYELLTGRRPWRGASTTEILQEIRHEEVRPPRQLVDSIDRELERICLRALANQASHRYTTALDFAEDLESWLQANQSSASSDSNVLANPQRLDDSGSQWPQVVPRGLRSYDVEDADFFLSLFPGPRDRSGIPDTIRFWITRLNACDADLAFPVGLVYGPSGCGKSSMIKAGVLPRLSGHVTWVYVEAQASATESAIREKLHRASSVAPDNLVRMFRNVRTASHRNSATKTVLVIDQFEQWLHQWQGQPCELVDALRQCDGASFQTLLMVRDDFWMGITRFMRELDIALVERQNSEGVDLFDERHARRVLLRFGQAYGCCETPPTGEQLSFINSSIELLSNEGRVTPVRLAVFAEMVKSRDWTKSKFAKLGGSEGIGVAFLDDVFGKSGPPQYRQQQSAIRQVLQSLLPESGTSIKGASRSFDDLMHSCNFTEGTEEFHDVIRILDNELRLITPYDSLSDPNSEGRVADRRYALTHDFLVPSIREWLTRELRATRRGRASLKLAERANDWKQNPENRRLPTLTEFVAIRSLTDGRVWTDDQQAMMRRATGWHVGRSLLIILAAALLLGALFFTRASSHASGLVEKLQSARAGQVSGILADMHSARRLVYPRLQAFEKNGLKDLDEEDRSRVQTFVDLALQDVDPTRKEKLIQAILRSSRAEFELIVSELQADGVSLETLWNQWRTASRVDANRRLRAALALANLDAEHDDWEGIRDDVANLVVRLPSQVVSEWLEPMERLVPRIKGQLMNRFLSGSPIEQENASRILASCLQGDADLQVALATRANERQLQAIAVAVSSSDEKVIQLLKQQLNSSSTEKTSLDDEELDQRYGSWANSLALLARGQSPEIYFRALQDDEDSTLRSFVVHRFARVVQDKSPLIDRLQQTPDPAVRQGILFTLGEIELGNYSAREYEQAKTIVLDLFVNEADAGVQAAADWLLRRWGLQEEMARREDQLPGSYQPDRDWYYTDAGLRMVVVRPQAYWVGTHPDQAQAFAVTRDFEQRTTKLTFAIADRETTGGQFDLFLQEHPRVGQVAENVVNRAVRYEDCPIMNVSWYEAAHFCNWLSEAEGIPPEEWCYMPNNDGKYASGMKMVKGRNRLTGYQLPFIDLWECAARGGTLTARPYGRGLELMPYYMWTQKTAQALAQPVGLLKPNRFGIFDALGNASEWAGSLFSQTPKLPEQVTIHNDIKFAVLGGSFRVHERSVRCDFVSRKFEASRDDLPTTFRVMRILPSSN